MVIATLAAVEDTNPDIYVRIASNPDPTKPADDEDAELATPTPPKPITSKLRTAVQHLRSRAGFWSRFRGIGMMMAYTAVIGFLSSLIPVRSFLGQFFVHSFLSILLATWQMAWVHIVISEPSPKRFYQRIPSYKTWIKIAPAAALEDVLTSAAFFLPMSFASFFGWLDTTTGDDVPSMVTLYRFMGATVIPAILAFLITMPARVIFVRVAASMLPEDDETIVPFDRSFGGKVSPAITGGSGKIGLMDAWTTFDWAARVRFAKVVGKTVAIEVAIGVLAALLLGGQVILMFGTAKPADTNAPGFQISWE
jgi:tetrahydromethanopterin S-methyltransferase subunit F